MADPIDDKDCGPDWDPENTEVSDAGENVDGSGEADGEKPVDVASDYSEASAGLDLPGGPVGQVGLSLFNQAPSAVAIGLEGLSRNTSIKDKSEEGRARIRLYGEFVLDEEQLENMDDKNQEFLVQTYLLPDGHYLQLRTHGRWQYRTEEDDYTFWVDFHPDAGTRILLIPSYDLSLSFELPYKTDGLHRNAVVGPYVLKDFREGMTQNTPNYNSNLLIENREDDRVPNLMSLMRLPDLVPAFENDVDVQIHAVRVYPSDVSEDQRIVVVPVQDGEHTYYVQYEVSTDGNLVGELRVFANPDPRVEPRREAAVVEIRGASFVTWQEVGAEERVGIALIATQDGVGGRIELQARHADNVKIFFTYPDARRVSELSSPEQVFRPGQFSADVSAVAFDLGTESVGGFEIDVTLTDNAEDELGEDRGFVVRVPVLTVDENQRRLDWRNAVLLGDVAETERLEVYGSPESDEVILRWRQTAETFYVLRFVGRVEGDDESVRLEVVTLAGLPGLPNPSMESDFVRLRSETDYEAWLQEQRLAADMAFLEIWAARVASDDTEDLSRALAFYFGHDAEVTDAEFTAFGEFLERQSGWPSFGSLAEDSDELASANEQALIQVEQIVATRAFANRVGFTYDFELAYRLLGTLHGWGYTGEAAEQMAVALMWASAQTPAVTLPNMALRLVEHGLLGETDGLSLGIGGRELVALDADVSLRPDEGRLQDVVNLLEARDFAGLETLYLASGDVAPVVLRESFVNQMHPVEVRNESLRVVIRPQPDFLQGQQRFEIRITHAELPGELIITNVVLHAGVAGGYDFREARFAFPNTVAKLNEDTRHPVELKYDAATMTLLLRYYEETSSSLWTERTFLFEVSPGVPAVGPFATYKGKNIPKFTYFTTYIQKSGFAPTALGMPVSQDVLGQRLNAIEQQEHAQAIVGVLGYRIYAAEDVFTPAYAGAVYLTENLTPERVVALRLLYPEFDPALMAELHRHGVDVERAYVLHERAITRAGVLGYDDAPLRRPLAPEYLRTFVDPGYQRKKEKNREQLLLDWMARIQDPVHANGDLTYYNAEAYAKGFEQLASVWGVTRTRLFFEAIHNFQPQPPEFFAQMAMLVTRVGVPYSKLDVSDRNVLKNLVRAYELKSINYYSEVVALRQYGLYTYHEQRTALILLGWISKPEQERDLDPAKFPQEAVPVPFDTFFEKLDDDGLYLPALALASQVLYDVDLVHRQNVYMPEVYFLAEELLYYPDLTQEQRRTLLIEMLAASLDKGETKIMLTQIARGDFSRYLEGGRTYIGPKVELRELRRFALKLREYGPGDDAFRYVLGDELFLDAIKGFALAENQNEIAEIVNASQPAWQRAFATVLRRRPLPDLGEAWLQDALEDPGTLSEYYENFEEVAGVEFDTDDLATSLAFLVYAEFRRAGHEMTDAQVTQFVTTAIPAFRQRFAYNGGEPFVLNYPMLPNGVERGYQHLLEDRSHGVAAGDGSLVVASSSEIWRGELVDDERVQTYVVDLSYVVEEPAEDATPVVVMISMQDAAAPRQIAAAREAGMGMVLFDNVVYEDDRLHAIHRRTAHELEAEVSMYFTQRFQARRVDFVDAATAFARSSVVAGYSLIDADAVDLARLDNDLFLQSLSGIRLDARALRYILQAHYPQVLDVLDDVDFYWDPSLQAMIERAAETDELLIDRLQDLDVSFGGQPLYHVYFAEMVLGQMLEVELDGLDQEAFVRRFAEYGARSLETENAELTMAAAHQNALEAWMRDVREVSDPQVETLDPANDPAVEAARREQQARSANARRAWVRGR